MNDTRSSFMQGHIITLFCQSVSKQKTFLLSILHCQLLCMKVSKFSILLSHIWVAYNIRFFVDMQFNKYGLKYSWYEYQHVIAVFYHIPVLCLSHQYSSYSTGSSVGV